MFWGARCRSAALCRGHGYRQSSLYLYHIIITAMHHTLIMNCCTPSTPLVIRSPSQPPHRHPRRRWSSSGARSYAARVDPGARRPCHTHRRRMAWRRYASVATEHEVNGRSTWRVLVTYVFRQVGRLRERSVRGTRSAEGRALYSWRRAHLSQNVHLNGLWPLCVRLWIVRAPATVNALPHPGKSQR